MPVTLGLLAAQDNCPHLPLQLRSILAWYILPDALRDSAYQMSPCADGGGLLYALWLYGWRRCPWGYIAPRDEQGYPCHAMVPSNPALLTPVLRPRCYMDVLIFLPNPSPGVFSLMAIGVKDTASLPRRALCMQHANKPAVLTPISVL